jgi:hypothetical protein
MSDNSILAIDLVKGSFLVCGVAADGAVVLNRSVSRPRLYQLLAEQADCTGASVDLNRFWAFSKWISALVTPPPFRALAG